MVVLLLRSQSEASLAVKGAYMEVVADTVGSIGVLIAGIVTVTTGWPYADVVVAVLVALWVLPRAIALARAALRILSESSPDHIDVDELRTALEAVDGVTGVHDQHAVRRFDELVLGIRGAVAVPRLTAEPEALSPTTAMPPSWSAEPARNSDSVGRRPQVSTRTSPVA